MHKAKRRALMASAVPMTSYGHDRTNPKANTVAVLEMLECNADGTSRVRTMTVDNVRQHKLHSQIREHVEEGSKRCPRTRA